MFHPSKVKQYVLEKEQATGRNVQERRLFNQYLKKYLQAGGFEVPPTVHRRVTAPKIRNEMCCNDENKGWNGEKFDPGNITCSEDVQTTEDSYDKCKDYKNEKCNKISNVINEDTTLDEHEWFLNMSNEQQLGDECKDKICMKMMYKVDKYFEQAMETKDLKEKQKMLKTLEKYAKTCKENLRANDLPTKIEELNKNIEELQKEEAQKEEAEKGGCAIM